MPGTNLNNLDAYNEVEAALGGSGAQLNDMAAVRAIAVLEGVSGGPADVRDDNMVLRLNAIDVGAGGPGTHENTLDALNSIVVLKGGVGGHFNDLDAINEWVDFVFVGPLDDLPSTAVAWSVTRRLLSSFTGNLLRVRRSSDNAELDIGPLGNGDLDVAAMETFCGAGDGFIVTTYDQSGNGLDRTNATAAQQAQIVSAGSTILDANGKPVGQYDGTDDYDTATAFSFTALTAFIIVKIIDLTGNFNGVMSFGPVTGDDQNQEDGLVVVFMDSADSKVSAARIVGSDTFLPTPVTVDGAQQLIQTRLDGLGIGGIRVAADIEETDTYDDLNSIDASKIIVGTRWQGGAPDAAQELEMDLSEAVLFDSFLSAGDLTLMRNDFNAFYGVTV